MAPNFVSYPFPLDFSFSSVNNYRVTFGPMHLGADLFHVRDIDYLLSSFCFFFSSFVLFPFFLSFSLNRFPSSASFLSLISSGPSNRSDSPQFPLFVDFVLFHSLQFAVTLPFSSHSYQGRCEETNSGGYGLGGSGSIELWRIYIIY